MPSHLRRYDEPGHVHFWTISCYRRLAFFWHDDLKQIVVDALRHLRDAYQICLIAYVIMPEHVHVVLLPHASGSDEPIPISRVLHAFKKKSGIECKQRLRDLWREHGRLWSAPLNRWARGELGKQVIWNTRGYDFNIFDERTLRQKIDYCHKNPVTRGLVDSPEDWRYGSYRYYEMDDRSVLPMDWDGRWPIEW